MLLVDWFAHIGTNLGMDFTHSGGDEQAFNLGPSNGFQVMAYSSDSPPYLDFVANDSTQQGIVNTIVFEAVKRVEGLDFGSGVWYSTSLPEAEYTLEPHSPMVSLMGRVNSQVRITGWRRLDTQILLEFTEIAINNEGKQSLLAPRAVVHVHIKTPGPCDGFFSSHLAHYYIRVVPK